MREGLRRVSAVFWGFWGLVCAALVYLFAVAAEYPNPTDAAASAAGIGVCYALHRLTCWVIDGFFAKGIRQ